MQRLRWGFMNWGHVWMTVFCMSHFWLWTIIQWQKMLQGQKYIGVFHKLCWQDFTHYWLPTHPICAEIPLNTKMRENLHTVDISSSIHLSGLVNVVCECLLAQKNAGWPKVLFRQLIGFKNIAKIFIDCWTVHLKTESDPIFTPTPSTFWWQLEKSTLFRSNYKEISTMETVGRDRGA